MPNENGSVSNGTINNIQISKDGKNVYIAERGDLCVFSRDIQYRQLTFIKFFPEVNGMEFTEVENSCAISPDDLYLYVTGGKSISVFKRNPANDSLDFRSKYTISGYTQFTLPSKDNRFLYNLSDDDGSYLTVFKNVHPVDTLSLIQLYYINQYKYIEAFEMTLSPLGNIIYASSNYNSIASFLLTLLQVLLMIFLL